MGIVVNPLLSQYTHVPVHDNVGLHSQGAGQASVDTDDNTTVSTHVNRMELYPQNGDIIELFFIAILLRKLISDLIMEEYLSSCITGHLYRKVEGFPALSSILRMIRKHL